MKNYAELKKEFEAAKKEAPQEIAAVIIQAGDKGITADAISITLNGCISKGSIYGFIYNSDEVKEALAHIGYRLYCHTKKEEVTYVNTTNLNDVITVIRKTPMFSAEKVNRR